MVKVKAPSVKEGPVERVAGLEKQPRPSLASVHVRGHITHRSKLHHHLHHCHHQLASSVHAFVIPSIVASSMYHFASLAKHNTSQPPSPSATLVRCIQSRAPHQLPRRRSLNQRKDSLNALRWLPVRTPPPPQMQGERKKEWVLQPVPYTFCFDATCPQVVMTRPLNLLTLSPCKLLPIVLIMKWLSRV